MTSNNDAATTRRWATRLVALVLLLSACSQASTEITAGDTGDSSSDPAEEQSDGEAIPIPDYAVFANTVGEYCGGTGDSRIEMAFGGTVRAIVSGPPAPVDEQTETKPNPGPQPWVTFDVDAWYTDDLGSEIALWAPDFDGQPGQRWLIAASRYHVGDAASGDVYWCESVRETSEELVAWSERYGGTVDPGADKPEGNAPAELLAQIDAAEARWWMSAPIHYTAVVLAEGNVTESQEGCPRWKARIVVSNGEMVQAVNPDHDCAIPLADAPTIEGLFDQAKVAAGATEFGIEFDAEYGFITSLGAKDRSIEIYGGVSQFVPEDRPYGLAGDREAMTAALVEARAQWQAAAITDYTMTVDNLCFCGFGGPLDVTVVDGIVVSSSGGDERSPNIAEEFDLTVNEIFDRVEHGIEQADGIQVAYHPELGYPVDVDIDYTKMAVDDELQILVENLQASG